MDRLTEVVDTGSASPILDEAVAAIERRYAEAA
jgi:hypothetical protein